MPRLFVHVEGQTEQDFVDEILGPHLLLKGYWAVTDGIIGNPRRRGGIPSWPEARRDIARHLKEDPSCVATTMVDYYGLPSSGEPAGPGRVEANRATSAAKALYVENALLQDMESEMGKRFDARRFVPFVVLHEFESLLFSNCVAFSRGISQPELEDGFRQIRDQFPTPEDINDSPFTAPSKRIAGLYPRYEKRLMGCLAALEIGLKRIRQECPHFNGMAYPT
jgi:hypothetical protein